jgi:hypothetical protein
VSCSSERSAAGARDHGRSYAFSSLDLCAFRFVAKMGVVERIITCPVTAYNYHHIYEHPEIQGSKFMFVAPQTN